jgi:electron transport complex protein RnfD
MAALGAVFAIVVVKEFFGGLGANVFNPALVGRAFLLMSFPAAITTWSEPLKRGADAVSAATPLGTLKELVNAPDAVTGASLHFFTGTGSGVAERAGFTGYADMIGSLFLGTHAGSIGESSALLIIIGGVFLLVTKTIDLRAPLAMLAALFAASIALGVDPLLAVLSGGAVFGAFFMATDYVSAPVTEGGRIIFGAGAGLITALIRRFGSYPEGVMFAILIMNALTPFLNRILHKKYGFQTPKKGGSK